MKVKVDLNKCLGCGACTQIAPEVFELVEDKSKVKKDAPLDNPEIQEQIKMAADSCPTQAIEIQD